MKNIIKTTLILGLISIFSCTETEKVQESKVVVPDPRSFLRTTNSTFFGTIDFTSTHINNGVDVSFDASALFTNQQTSFLKVSDGVYAGDISIGGISLDYASMEPKMYDLPSSEYWNQTHVSKFGSALSISVSGDSTTPYGSGSTIVNTPETINIHSPFSSNSSLDEISAAGGIPLNWNGAPSGNVAVVLEYDQVLTNELYPGQGFSTTTIFKTYLSTDDGQFVIPATDLSTLPIGGIYNVYIARGSDSELVLSDGKNIIIGTYSVAREVFKLNP